MKIKELHIQNFRGFQDINIKFPDTHLAVFIGENGSGKSSVLDAIAMVLVSFLAMACNYKDYDIENDLFLSDNDIRDDFKNINITIQFHSINIPDFYFLLGKVRNTESYNKTGINPYDYIQKIRNLPVLKYFPTYGEFFYTDNNTTKTDLSDKFRIYKNAFKDEIYSFQDFLDWFKGEEDYENERKIRDKDLNYTNLNLNSIRYAIELFYSELLNGNFDNLRVQRKLKYEPHNIKIERGIYPKYDHKDYDFTIDKNGKTLFLSQLSSGEKMTLMLVADIARRLSLANPALSGTDVLQGEGIVLIDEIELHLHPAWQRQIFPALRKTFPQIQFIVTTHSPQVLSSIEKESIFILKDFKVIENTPYSQGRDSNSILFDMFGLEKRPKEDAEQLRKFYDYLEKEDIENAKIILEKLTSKWGDYDVEIKRANMYLEDLIEDNEIH